MKKTIKSAIWIIIAIGALAFFYNIIKDEPAFIDAFKSISWSWVYAALGVYISAQTLLAKRWVMLLSVYGLNIGIFQAIKLTYLGLFYNNFFPGAIGGDLLKGWYIRKHSSGAKQVEAVMSVVVDRFVGLIGMIWVAGIASLFAGKDIKVPLVIGGEPVAFQLRWLAWGIFVAMIVLGVIFFSHRIRRILKISWFLNRYLKGDKFQRIDEAVQIYRHHLKIVFASIVMTAVIQGSSIFAVWLLSQALGYDKVHFGQCLIIMPVIWVISAVIPVPGGLGVIEGLGTLLFSLVIDPVNPGNTTAIAQGAALGISLRVVMCICSLPGALVPALGGHLPKRCDMAEAT